MSEHPYCERCLAAGIARPAEHVHHIVHLTMDNYTDPMVALNPDNLEALCIDCHNAEHKATPDVRSGLYFDTDGNLRELTGRDI